MGRPLEQVVSGFLRPPLRKFRGAEVERLAPARDAVSVSDLANGVLAPSEGRVGYARTGYSEVGAVAPVANPDTSSTLVTTDSTIITTDTWTGG